MTSPSSMHETGHSKLVHWDNPEGWNGEGGGSVVRERGDTCTPMAKEGLFAPCPSLRQMLHAIKSHSNEVDEPAAYYTE